MTQFLDQRLRLLQVLGVKAFGEPVVDFGGQLACCDLLALLCLSRARLVAARNSHDLACWR